MREKQKQVEKERRGVLEYWITLSLSQTLAYKRAAQHLIILLRARAAGVNIRLFLQRCKRSRIVFVYNFSQTYIY